MNTQRLSRLAVLVLAACLPASALASERALTVATYNIHHGAGVDDQLDLDRIAGVLHETGADLIGLQEVDRHWSERSDFVDQASALAEKLGMQVVYGANLDDDPLTDGAARRQYGTALLSAYPIVSWSNTKLPNLGGEQRGLLEAVVRVDGTSLRVLNTHLQHNNQAERTAQAEAIGARLDRIREPVVLVGDLNAQPGQPELSAIERRLDDAHLLAGEGDGFTHPAEAAASRIDYVFVSPCVEVASTRVTATLASDHLPLTAALQLPARGDRRCESAAFARAHAHNDYEHTRPLLDALDAGFASVEADVWLVDGKLLVAHDADKVDPARTLESLYLEPLLARVRENHGRVYEGWEHSLQLLIDIKSEAEPTYRALHEVLARYRRLFTRFTPDAAYEGPVTAVISGNRPRALMVAQPVRYAGYDGRSADLGSGDEASFIPLISDNWTNLFKWTGEGTFPADERAKLADFVARAHANGQRVRFWATPEVAGVREAIWAELVRAGVDYINTDDLPGLHAWLDKVEPRPSKPALDWFDAHDAWFERLYWLGWQ